MDQNIRSYLVAKHKSFVRIFFGGYALMIAVALIGARIGAVWLLVPAVIAFMAIFLSFLWRGIPCPKCGVNLLCLIWYLPTRSLWSRFWSFPKEYRFCPGCGVSFDESSP